MSDSNAYAEVRRLAALIGRAQVLLEHVHLDCKPTDQDWHDRVHQWLEDAPAAILGSPSDVT